MGPQFAFLAQSRFYSPAFNAAIFDGPFRIYFAQYQESFALRIYFSAQQRLNELYQEMREKLKGAGINIYVMLYPSDESFRLSFTMDNADPVLVDRLGNDYVVGIRGPLQDGHIDRLNDQMVSLASRLVSELPVTPPAMAEQAI